MEDGGCLYLEIMARSVRTLLFHSQTVNWVVACRVSEFDTWLTITYEPDSGVGLLTEWNEKVLDDRFSLLLPSEYDLTAVRTLLLSYCHVPLTHLWSSSLKTAGTQEPWDSVIHLSGQEGTVRCHEYHGSFEVEATSDGMTWRDPFSPRPQRVGHSRTYSINFA